MAGNGTREVNLTEIQKSYLAISRQISNTVLTEEDSERYSGFVMWLRNINQLAEDFYTPDENGNYPVMDQVSLNAFQDSYKRALEECDDVLAQNSNDGISGRMKEIAGEVRKHLLRDSAGFVTKGTVLWLVLSRRTVPLVWSPWSGPLGLFCCFFV